MRVIQDILPLLTLFFLLPIAGEAGEHEVLTGKIFSVDISRGVMEIDRTQGESGNQRIQVMLPAGNVTSSSVHYASWENCLEVGKEVKLWGHEIHDDGSFAVEQVQGCSMAGCNDPTGVRGRLYQNRKMGRQAGLCRE